MRRSPPTKERTARTLALAISLVAALVLVPGAAAATEQVASGVVVGENETVSDDLTVASGDVIVRGTVEGDLSALAGSVTVTGEVTEDVSAAAGEVTINGTVGEDVSAAGESVVVGPDGRVGEDVGAGAETVIVEGHVEEDVHAGSDVRLGPDSTVGGDVVYGEDVERADGATVDGELRQDSGDWHLGWTGVPFGGGPDFGPLPDGWGPVYWTLVALLAGSVLLLIAPAFSDALLARATDEPLRSTAAGIGTLAGVPVVLVVLLITVVGIPVALAGGATYAVAVWLGLIYGEYLVGRSVLAALDVSNRWAGLALGVIGVETLSRLPWIGGLLKFVVLLVGLGAGVLVAIDRWRDGDGGDAGARPDPDSEAEPAPGTA